MSNSTQLHSFTTSRAHLSVMSHLITLTQFVGNIAFDLGIAVVTCILWKIFWHSLNKLTIRNIDTGRDEPIGLGEPILNNIKSLHRILKNLTITQSGYVMEQCGFEAFTYLFFLRRFTHLMAIFTLTDIFVWIPYQLIFTDPTQFSLVTTSSTNYLFRTFYTLWVTVAVLYGVMDMKAYLRLLLKNKLFRNSDIRSNLINNLKSKTAFIHFARENRKLDLLEVKTRLVEKLRIEDSIVGIVQLPNNSKKIQFEYEYKIYNLVKTIGIQNFSSLWHFFKRSDTEQLRGKLKDRYQRLYLQDNRKSQAMDRFVEEIKQEKQVSYINSYLVAFQNISTPEDLMNQIQSKRGCCDRCIDTRQKSEVEYYFDDDFSLSISWAQEPGDVIWMNIGAPDKVRAFRFVLFNVLSGLLIAIGFLMIVFARSTSILKIPVIPSVVLPFMLSAINAALRWLISKSSQWENQHFQSQMQMKEMKVLIIFFAINVIGGSIVRDTLNLVSILTTGWGFIQLFGLIYRQPDGFFYYGYVFNELSLTFFSALYKLGDIFPQVFNAGFTYQKNTQIRYKSRYGTNDPFRYGYNYSLDIIMFGVIFMYSASCPLIHFFGLLYFFGKYYSEGYTLIVFHKREETCSNLRFIQKVCDYIIIVMILVIFLIGVTLMFAGQYSGVLILYLWEGVIIYILSREHTGASNLKDYYTDDQLQSQDRTQCVREWKQLYLRSMQPMETSEFQFSGHSNRMSKIDK